MASSLASPGTLNRIKTLLALILLLNGALWFSLRYERPTWTNVPPVPSAFSAVLPTLGDKQFAYRVIALTIQNFGYTGGKETNLADYNYEELGNWFMLQHRLDPISNATPFVAGYVFGANKNHENLAPVINYLDVAGDVDHPQKWRLLVQAAFLARHRMQDHDRAYTIASKLAQMDDPEMPAWTKQMPAFIRNNQGDKQAALGIMLELLRSEGETMHPSEINAIKGYICEQILSPQEAQTYPLCQGTF